MTRYIPAAIFLVAGILPSAAHSQTASARTREIAALFSKEKHAIKQKHGVRTEKYVKVVAEPQAAANPSTYSGTYRDFSFDFVIRLRVSSDGTVEGSGEDPVEYASNVSRSLSQTEGSTARCSPRRKSIATANVTIWKGYS